MGAERRDDLLNTCMFKCDGFQFICFFFMFFVSCLRNLWTSLAAQLVKNAPAMWETWVRSLDWEDSLEKGKAIHLQYSGLKNSMDCIFHGVAKSQI